MVALARTSAVHADFVTSSGGHPQAAAAAFLVFLLAYTPCVATLAAQKRQIGTRWTGVGVVMQLAMAWLLAVAVFQIGVAYVLVTTGIRSVPALDVSLLLLVETACNPAWSWLLLGEVPSMFALVGGGVIISATVLNAMHAASRPLQVEVA